MPLIRLHYRLKVHFSSLLKTITAILTVSSFFISAVSGQAFAAGIEILSASNRIQDVFNQLTLPASFGRITQAKSFNSPQIVINIQDLHCHAEVQKNISRILELLDEKYHLPTIYLEGAHGKVDTSWLNNIKNDKIRRHIVDGLLNDGE
jgi:hypothetical protein